MGNHHCIPSCYLIIKHRFFKEKRLFTPRRGSMSIENRLVKLRTPAECYVNEKGQLYPVKTPNLVGLLSIYPFQFSILFFEFG